MECGEWQPERVGVKLSRKEGGWRAEDMDELMNPLHDVPELVLVPGVRSMKLRFKILTSKVTNNIQKWPKVGKNNKTLYIL